MAKARKKKQPRNVCILGYAEETRDMVFQLGEDVEVWGINMAHVFTHGTDSAGSIVPKTRAKATNWFQLHPRDWATPKGEVTGFFGRPKEHLAFLNAFEGTVWLQEPDPDIPNGQRYPLEAIVAASGRSYFTSTFAYQLALLWYQVKVELNPVNRLYVYGVNLSSIDEYIHQKPCVEYWLGRLEEEGVTITIPDGSALLKGKLYGRGTGGDISDHAFERLQHYKGRYMESWASLNTSSSMKAETRYWARKLSELSDKFPEQFTEELTANIQGLLSARAGQLDKLVEKSTAELNGTLGFVKDNQHWLALTGGIDHHAPALPEVRLPTPALEHDINLPAPQAI